MNLRDKIGQLFILGFQGSSTAKGDAIAEDITRRNLGGVILFDRFIAEKRNIHNITSPQQVQQLCTELQSLSPTELLISIDQEGGMVRRLKPKEGFPDLPSAAHMADTQNDFEESRYHADKTGKLLAELGINLNFAPVADLKVNPLNPIIGKIDRSFSRDPEAVGKHCEIWLDSMQNYGVLGCVKHFPGHGSSTGDSHKQFVDISSTWIEDELLPYQYLLSQKKVHAIMAGHLFHKDFDQQHPASLSENFIEGILRRKLNYTGIVITDDMQMRGITDRYGLLDAFVLALSAGVDIIVVGNNIEYDPDILKKAINYIEKSIEQGRLTIERIEQSYARVKMTKEQLL